MVYLLRFDFLDALRGLSLLRCQHLAVLGHFGQLRDALSKRRLQAQGLAELRLVGLFLQVVALCAEGGNGGPHVRHLHLLSHAEAQSRTCAHGYHEWIVPALLGADRGSHLLV